jgi:epoxyqueuosine reductase
MQNKLPQEINYVVLTDRIRQWGAELGFQAVGISDTNLGEAEARLKQWLVNGYHGAMDYMAKHGSKRSRPAELIPGTLRVISVRLNYYPDNIKDAREVLADGERAFISRYALGRDYHKVMRNRLERLAKKIRAEARDCHCRVFTDSAPVLEVELAEKARLGWRGKHTLLLAREHGSYFFLGEIFTDLPLVTDAQSEDKIISKNHCGSCVACIDACPTRAIVAPYQVDARRCISYLTIEFKGSIPEALRGMMGNRIYGCDDCQIVCPWNRFAQNSLEPDFAARHALDDISLIELFSWDEATFVKKFEGSAVYRIGHEQWLRNIAVALGNAPTSPEVLKALRSRLADTSALIQEHINWALKQH